jgi:hypothetical protein
MCMQVASPCVNLFISPEGAVSITCAVDQVFALPYVVTGSSFPCQSVRGSAFAFLMRLCVRLRARSTGLSWLLLHLLYFVWVRRRNGELVGCTLKL